MPRILNSVYARLWRAAKRASIPRYRGELQPVLQAHAGQPVVIFPPGLGWKLQLFQRPQQLAQALARQGALVFYMEPVHPSSKRGLYREAENLYLCHVPLETFQIIEHAYLHVMTWNARAAKRLTEARVIYDYVDDLGAFEGSPERLASAHRQMLAQAWLVLATARRLFQEVQATRPDSLLVPNGVDYAHFAPSAVGGNMVIPADMAPVLAQGKPVVGYHGALARWFNFELVEKVAWARLDLNFVLVGPDIDGSLRESGLLEVKNIHWLEVKTYQELPGYLGCFDVGVIPFKLNEITHSTSPIKLFEYLAAGKPVVVTPMQESLRLGAALSAEGAEEFCRQLDRALELRSDTGYITSLQQTARENTWDARAGQILEALRARE